MRNSRSVWQRLIVVCILATAAPLALAAPCGEARVQSNLAASDGDYPIDLCVDAVELGWSEGARIYSGTGSVTPGGELSFTLAITDDSLDLTLRRGGLSHRLLLTDHVFRSQQNLPDGRYLRRYVELEAGGLLSRLEELSAKSGALLGRGYEDQPLHDLGLQLLASLDLDGRADARLISLLQAAPALQYSMDDSRAVVPSRGEIETLLTLPVAPVVDEGDPYVEQLRQAVDPYAEFCEVVVTEYREPTTNECPRCIEDDQAHAKVQSVSVNVPQLGEVSISGIEAFTHARCFEGEGSSDCIGGNTTGNIQINNQMGGSCTNRDHTKIWGFEVSGDGTATAGTGHCRYQADDYACALKITGPLGLSWEQNCSTGENAVCMQAEASIDLSINICLAGLVPYIESSGTISGSAGAC